MPVRVDENSQPNATIQVTRKKMVVRVRRIRETEIASASMSRANTYERSSTVFPRAVRNSIRWSERLNQAHRFNCPVSRPEHEFASLFVVSPACLFETVILSPGGKRRVFNADSMQAAIPAEGRSEDRHVRAETYRLGIRGGVPGTKIFQFAPQECIGRRVYR